MILFCIYIAYCVLKDQCLGVNTRYSDLSLWAQQSALPFTSQHSRTHSLHIRIAILVTRTALATHCSGFYRQATTGRVLEPSFLVHTLLLFDDAGLLSPSDELTRTSLLLTTHCQTSNQAALLPLALATTTHCRLIATSCLSPTDPLMIDSDRS